MWSLLLVELLVELGKLAGYIVFAASVSIFTRILILLPCPGLERSTGLKWFLILVFFFVLSEVIGPVENDEGDADGCWAD